MANRKLYRLQKDGDAVIVFRTDNNIGRLGVVFTPDKGIRHEYGPRIPKYIIREARNIIKADPWELERGYTYGGAPCRAC